LLVLESMKTQQSLIAPVAGQVVRLAVSVGDQVQHDQLLALVEPLAQ
jgi:biotin carboxyl carrier protein